MGQVPWEFYKNLGNQNSGYKLPSLHSVRISSLCGQGWAFLIAIVFYSSDLWLQSVTLSCVL